MAHIYPGGGGTDDNSGEEGHGVLRGLLINKHARQQTGVSWSELCSGYQLCDLFFKNIYLSDCIRS